ncbi:MAG: DUF4959 domain-containing protein [Bacteroidales bacterium]|nr:DUF4959 domain-containing protein [Bacteroidales bacterium]
MKNRMINFIKSSLRGFWGLLLLMPVIGSGCKEEGRIDFIDGSAPAPAQVSNVTVRNAPGEAVLKYTLPADENLLYVWAVYDIRPGVTHETKASYYKDSLVLEGFGDTRIYDVNLYSVGKNEKVSDPLHVQVAPLTPSVLLATQQLAETFGGVSVKVENPGKANLAIVLMGDTAHLGYQTYLYTFYLSMEKANFSLRGLDTISSNYSAYIRDRWNNLSDTIEATLKPWYEEFIAKDSWREVNLPDDAPALNPDNQKFDNMWDENYTDHNGGAYFSQSLPLPQTITIDLGKTVTLSRMKMWPRNVVDDRWKRAHAKRFEVWGSMSPNIDGSYDESWIPLGKFECLKPMPGETITAEDIAYAQAGIEYDFEVSDFAPDPFVPVRYIRVRTLETYAGTTISNVSYQEFSFWGLLMK